MRRGVTSGVSYETSKTRDVAPHLHREYEEDWPHARALRLASCRWRRCCLSPALGARRPVPRATAWLGISVSIGDSSAKLHHKCCLYKPVSLSDSCLKLHKTRMVVCPGPPRPPGAARRCIGGWQKASARGRRPLGRSKSHDSCTGFTIISTTYVSEHPKPSTIVQLHM